MVFWINEKYGNHPIKMNGPFFDVYVFDGIIDWNIKYVCACDKRFWELKYCCNEREKKIWKIKTKHFWIVRHADFNIVTAIG